jgi:hypothetical protein
MQRIVELLNEKNQHLQAFHQLNSEEMSKFEGGNFETLEKFYNSREALLEMIRAIDSMVDEAQSAIDPLMPIETDFKRHVLKALDEKNDLVTQILVQDLQILSAIETAKSNIIRELSQVRSNRKAVGAYKSNEPVNQLDEEY